jgi:hypothetical protein
LNALTSPSDPHRQQQRIDEVPKNQQLGRALITAGCVVGRANLLQYGPAALAQLGTQRILVVPRKAGHPLFEMHGHVQRSPVNRQVFAGHEKSKSYATKKAVEGLEGPKPQRGCLRRISIAPPIAIIAKASV